METNEIIIKTLVSNSNKAYFSHAIAGGTIL